MTLSGTRSGRTALFRGVLGVIGHVDHGKTALVRALTGMETDRLAEEQRRGISIVLGFAHFAAGDAEIDLIDMPGHERFVRTMIAGATGIDGVLLVVAANEGVRPQTVEHIQIAGLLGLRRAVVAVSKADLVTQAEAVMAGEAAARLAAEAGLSPGVPVLTSALRGEGIAALRGAILGDLADAAAPRIEDGFAWLPVDRSFSRAGHGTIVTGTLRHGGIAAGEELELLPQGRPVGRPVRVRGLQVHGQSVTSAAPGQRVAVNLRGIEADAVARGDALAMPGHLLSAQWLSVMLRLLPDAPELRSGARVQLLLGTTESSARLRLLDRETLAPDETAAAQLHCAVPVAVPARERFVIRAASPARTLGGGHVLDADATRLRRHAAPVLRRLAALAAETPAQTLAREVAEAGAAGRALPELSRLVGLSPARAMAVLEAAQVVAVRGAAVDRAAFELVLRDLPSLAGAAGRERARLTEALHTTPPVFEEALSRLIASGTVRQEGGRIWQVVAGQERARAEAASRLAAGLAERLRAAGLSPPDPKHLAAADPTAMRALAALAREGVLVRTFDRVQKREILFHRDAVLAAQQTLAPLLAKPPGLLVSEAGAALGISRKFSVPLLEYLDAIQYTRRVADRRVLAPRGG
ncbi:MAG TPA: selenocysteine-specific translation elongation factor [Acetobacteraceae bacterium]|nr:selenocysteine-specific translation elongation factor [Acetobacteraceae bacterium]